MKTIWNKIVNAANFFLKGPRIPYHLCVIAMDGANRTEHVDIPMKETIDFLERWSRFKFTLTVLETNVFHTLNTVTLEGGARTYLMLKDNMTPEYLATLPVADSYLFLYSTRLKPGTLGLPKLEDGSIGDPYQGGSTMGVPDGILKGGKKRPYATVPWEIRWYGNWPTGGFMSQAAQILVHEVNNCINCITAWIPYNCTPFDVTGGPSAYEHEKKRIQTLGADCYKKLRQTIQSAE